MAWEALQRYKVHTTEQLVERFLAYSKGKPVVRQLRKCYIQGICIRPLLADGSLGQLGQFLHIYLPNGPSAKESLPE